MAQALTPLEQAYQQRQSYPANILWKPYSRFALKSWQSKLQDFDTGRILCREGKQDVPLVDISTQITNGVASNTPHGTILKSTADLENVLGTRVNPTDPLALSKADPHCRLVCLTPKSHSRDELKITKEMLLMLLSFHQVMPAYLELLALFGRQEDYKDIRYSKFRSQSSLASLPTALHDATLRRSSGVLQVCYNLKSVGSSKGNGDVLSRSFRHAGIYNHFDVEQGKTLWIFTLGNFDVWDTVKGVVGRDGKAEDKDFSSRVSTLHSVLALHLVLCEWTLGTWQTYVQDFESYVQLMVRNALHGVQQHFAVDDLNHAQVLEARLSDVELQLKANRTIMESLKNFYIGLLQDTGFHYQNECRLDLKKFGESLQALIEDTRLLVTRVELLRQVAADRKVLVTQRLQTQATTRMEVLSTSMYKETIAMRVIAGVTLIYLPATFVSSFFSTDVVKYQLDSDSSAVNSTDSLLAAKQPQDAYSHLAMERWLEVAIPLTVLTMVLALGYFLYTQWPSKEKSGKILP